MSIWLRLGATTPATEVAPHTPPTWETLADGGSGQCDFEVGRAARHAPHLLRAGTLLEVMCGPSPLWLGRVDDYSQADGRVTGLGIHADALHIPALDAAGNASRDIAAALPPAMAAPWRWRVNNARGVTGVAQGEGGEPLMMAGLMGAVAEQEGKRWGQHPDGSLYLTTDPTTPTWTLHINSDAAWGSTGETGAPTHLVGRYLDGTVYRTIRVGDDTVPVGRAETVNLTDRGTLTAGEATGILTEMLSARGRHGWTGGVTVHREQLTRNGQPAWLPGVHASGVMVRAVGAPWHHGPWVDEVLAKTRYTAGSDTIYLEPTSVAPRNLRAVAAA